MLARITGANSGIGKYLRDGNKAGRFHTRDQMDAREVIHGDLALTESVIDSIENKGQERYLHITLSFKEKNLTKESLKDITNDYISDLMSAYKDDEYNYYAEAHRPKLKNNYNPSTDTMDERLLHVHVVIPKKNFVSNGRLNPTGRHLSNVDYLDAIQEKVNLTHGLESPRENQRDIISGREEAIARYTGELDSKRTSHQKSVKEQALEIAKNRNYDEFKKALSDHGEIKVRNKGKQNEYVAIKFEGDEKYTNLRDSVFSKEFLNNSPKPATATELEPKLNYWREIRSSEIKHISDASPRIRDEYSSLDSLEDKKEYLSSRSDSFYKKHSYKYSNENDEANNELPTKAATADKPGHHKRARGRRPSPNSRVYSLHGMQQRTLVHQQGRTLRVLQGNEHTHVHSEERGADRAEGLRRSIHGRGRGVNSQITSEPRDSYLAQSLEELKQERGSGQALSARALNNVSPNLVLDYCAKHYLIDTDATNASYSDSGKPRINCGNKKLSNTDFLTKEMNLSWPEARDILTSLYNKDSHDKAIPVKSSDVKKQWREFTSNTGRVSYKEEFAKIKDHYDFRYREIMTDFGNNKAALKAAQMSKNDRIYQNAVNIKNKMTAIENLKEERNNTVAAFRNSIKPYGKEEVRTMNNLDRWNEAIKASEKAKAEKNDKFKEHDTAIRPSVDFDSATETKRNIENASHNAQATSSPSIVGDTPITIRDLGVTKKKDGAHFTHNNAVVFADHGDFISSPKTTSKEMAELTLSYAVNRYGSSLEIKGSDDFKEKIVQAAHDKGLKVQFSDSHMNDRLKSLNEKKAEHDKNLPSIEEATKAAENLQKIPETHLGNDIAEKQYNLAISERIEKISPDNEKEIAQARSVQQASNTDIAKYRGKNLMPMGEAIDGNQDASKSYSTALREKVMLDKEQKHFLEEKRSNGEDIADNPSLNGSIEKGESLIKEYEKKNANTKHQKSDDFGME